MVSVLTSYSVGEITRKPSNRPLISVKDEMKRGSWNVDENQNSDNYHRNRNDGMPLPAMWKVAKHIVVHMKITFQALDS